MQHDIIANMIGHHLNSDVMDTAYVEDVLDRKLQQFSSPEAAIGVSETLLNEVDIFRTLLKPPCREAHMHHVVRLRNAAAA